MDLDDVLNTKKALNDLGFMSLPKYGLNTYPDQPMIDGVRSFQRRHSLREDGVMKPDGPTLGRLNQTLAERQPTTRAPNPLSKTPLPEQQSLLSSVLKPPNPLTRTPVRLDSASKVRGTEKLLPKPTRLAAFSAANQTPPSQPSTNPSTAKPKGEKQVASAAAAIPLIGELPGIISAIAAMLGLTLPLRGDAREEDKCDKQLRADLARCSQTARDNHEIYRRCEKTAMERYANCIAGRPLGPLDEGL